METKLKRGKLKNQLLIRMDDELSGRLIFYSEVNDMSLSSIIRRSLRQFFESEETKGKTVKPVRKKSPQL